MSSVTGNLSVGGTVTYGVQPIRKVLLPHNVSELEQVLQLSVADDIFGYCNCNFTVANGNDVGVGAVNLEAHCWYWQINLLVLTQIILTI